MKKISFKAACLVSLAMAVPAIAKAAMTIPFGWYVGLSQGLSKASNKYYPGDVQRTGYGINPAGGYKFSPYFTAEAGYTHYAETTVKNAFGAQAASDTHYSYDIAAKVLLPIGDTGAEFFGKVGVARMRSQVAVKAANASVNNLSFNSGTHYSTGAYMAAGGEYSITSNIAADLQWARAHGNKNVGNLDLYSLGLIYSL